MKKLTTTQREYLEVAHLFLWAYAQDFTAWFTGRWQRWKRTEYNLPQMVDKGALKTHKYGKKFVYAPPGKRASYSADIGHGLASTNALLRFKHSAEGEFLSERFLRSLGLKAVPEWAVIYPTSRHMILFEYSTADNFKRKRLMNKKLTSYRESLETFTEYFECIPFVLFVIEASDQQVKAFAKKKNLDDFFFTDLAAFTSIETGRQLQAPIYIWGGDGKRGPLS
jgi:hypothetical protein